MTKRIPWTRNQDAIIRKGYANGRAVKAIAQDVGKHPGSVVDRAIALGVRKATKPAPVVVAPVFHQPSLVDIPALRRPLP